MLGLLFGLAAEAAIHVKLGPDEVNVRRGSSTTLYCKSCSPQIEWSFRGANMKETIKLNDQPADDGENKYKQNRTSDGLFALEIKNMDEGDSGIYFCAEVVGCRRKAMSRVSVVSGNSSEVILEPKFVIVPVGNSTTLYCNSSSSRENLEWGFRSDCPSNAKDEITYQNVSTNPYKDKIKTYLTQDGRFALEIKNMQLDDTGQYFCAEDGGIGNKAYAHVEVTSASSCQANAVTEVSLEPTFVEVKVGNSTALYCKSSSRQVKWSFRSYRLPYVERDITCYGRLVRSLTNKYDLHDENDGRFTLKIKNMQHDDSGHYFCAEDEGIGCKANAYVKVVTDNAMSVSSSLFYQTPTSTTSLLLLTACAASATTYRVRSIAMTTPYN
jgi:hypothetical protein